MLKALEDRIIIKVDKQDEQVTSSGLIMTASQEVKNIGKVVAVGPGRVLPSGIRLEQDVAVGDTVMFTPMATQRIEHEGEELLTIFSRDILAVINE